MVLGVPQQPTQLSSFSLRPYFLRCTLSHFRLWAMHARPVATMWDRATTRHSFNCNAPTQREPMSVTLYLPGQCLHCVFSLNVKSRLLYGARIASIHLGSESNRAQSYLLSTQYVIRLNSNRDSNALLIACTSLANNVADISSALGIVNFLSNYSRIYTVSRSAQQINCHAVCLVTSIRKPMQLIFNYVFAKILKQTPVNLNTFYVGKLF